MNLFAPVSSIMTTNLLTVNPEDNLLKVREMFEKHHIHHLPVVRYREIVGIISKTDFTHFTGGLSHHQEDRFLNQSRLEKTKAEDLMTRGLGKVEPDDRINVVLEIFTKNLFHALPVVDKGELVGIVTTFDVIRALSEEKPEHPEDVYEQKPAMLTPDRIKMYAGFF